MSNQFSNTILGLDIGTNSIGWALLGCDEEGEPKTLIRTGVRVFQEAVEDKTREPKNVKRREKRLSRRTLRRRVQRKKRLAELMLLYNFFENQEELQKVITSPEYDPWALRVKGLDEPLTLQEFGRVLYHLAQRRGFLSTKKGANKKEEDSKLKKQRSELEKNLQDSGLRTFAEYIVRNNLPKRNQQPLRKMYEQEFELLWEKQREFNPEIFTQELQAKVHREIFFQRPTRVKPGSVGQCIFEIHKPRAMKGTLQFQEFRLRQDINNLKIIDTVTGELKELSQDEKQKLFEYMNVRKEAKWDQLRKVLGLTEETKFNFEESKSKLVGNETNAPLSKVLSKHWDKMKLIPGYYSWQTQQDALVEDLLTIDKVDDLFKRLTDPEKLWKFDEETARKLCEIELPNGYANLSLKAIRKILPYMQQGEKYSDACKLAGYDHSNPTQINIVSELPLPADLRNPVVNKAMIEVRKLVNAIIREYGIPKYIRVELAREVRETGEKLKESKRKLKEREKENEEIKNILQKEFDIASPSRDDIIRYRLWKECKGICPYTGTNITQEMLFSSDVDVEHILPYSRSLDDSQMNKTLCMAKENREVKKNQTPYEAYSGNPEKYDAIKHRIAHLPPEKRRRFTMKEIPDDFTNRHLNDTRYIARQVATFLKQLGSSVEVTQGKITSDIRHYWGLNRILNEEGDLEKNRADHRHHAIDAVVIAFTSRKLYTQIQTLFRLEGTYGADNVKKIAFRNLKKPWENFYNDVKQSIESIIVSHAPYRKVAGAFCEETAYGKTNMENVYTYRKPISSLTLADIKNKTIRDEAVRKIVEDRFIASGGNLELKSEKENKEVLKKAFGSNSEPLFHKDGKTPIKSVRVLVTFSEGTVLPVKDSNKEPYKYYPLGNNHHYELFVNDATKKKIGRIVTTLEAIRRIRERRPIVDKTPPEEGYRFLCSLVINDMVEREVNGKKLYYRVQKMSEGRINFRLHTAATLDYANEHLQQSPSKFDGKKIQVDLLGNIRVAND